MKVMNFFYGVLFVCAGAQAGNLRAATSPPVHHIADCPNINIEFRIITQPTCGEKNGSITNVVVTSTGTKVNYIWRDLTGAIVGKDLDLAGIGEGSYQLEVTDNSGCNQKAISGYINVFNASGVQIKEDGVVVHPSSCNNDGAIKGLVVTGATKYSWKSFSGPVYTSTTTADLVNVPPGTYKLTASNDNRACDAISTSYTIGPDFDLPLITQEDVGQPTCASFAGDSIVVHLTKTPGGPDAIWFFAPSDNPDFHIIEGRMLSESRNFTLKARGLKVGTYSLFVQRGSECPYALGTYALKATELAINVEKSAVANDRCNQHLGAITPIYEGEPAGVVPTYSWIDVRTGKIISTKRSLSRIGEGEYFVSVFFGLANCNVSAYFTVKNISPPLIPPVAAGSTICLPGHIGIRVTNINVDTAGVFKLYDAEDAAVAIDSNITGEFYRKVSKTTDFFLTRKHGECESDRTRVTETVVASIDITNTFTPNNDGINDTWHISGIEEFPDADVKVFDRYGHTVFNSLGYGTPFDGHSKGRLLPNGVYYYAIDLKQPVCYGKIAGSLTILH